eukprot:s591_g23.t1
MNLLSPRAMDTEMLQRPDEFATLCDCLFRSGVLRRDTFLAALHRRRFEAVRKAHPYAAHKSGLLPGVSPVQCTAVPLPFPILDLDFFWGSFLEFF